MKKMKNLLPSRNNREVELSPDSKKFSLSLYLYIQHIICEPFQSKLIQYDEQNDFIFLLLDQVLCKALNILFAFHFYRTEEMKRHRDGGKFWPSLI